MNIPSLHEEKKTSDLVDTDRIERLELLVEILCSDLLHVKEQQLRSQKQVLDLQADLAAAELAREDAERQMEQLQLRDHQLLLSLLEKQTQEEGAGPQTIKLIPHTRTASINRSIKSQDVDLIDVTSYGENISEYERMNEQVHHLDDIQLEESSCDQYVLQLWEDLSSSVQQLSSDLIEQRDAFEFVSTKFQLTSNQRITALEEASANQLDALKVLATEWDTKITELNDQVQKVNHEFSAEKTLTTDWSTEINAKVQNLGEQLIQLQSSVQRHMDYNRCMNGERLVMKRDHELQLQKLNDMVQNLNTTIQDQADQRRAPPSEQIITSGPNPKPDTPIATSDEVPPEPVESNVVVIDDINNKSESVNIVIEGVDIPESENGLTEDDDDQDDNVDHPQRLATLVLQRRQSY